MAVRNSSSRLVVRVVLEQATLARQTLFPTAGLDSASDQHGRASGTLTEPANNWWQREILSKHKECQVEALPGAWVWTFTCVCMWLEVYSCWQNWTHQFVSCLILNVRTGVLRIIKLCVTGYISQVKAHKLTSWAGLPKPTIHSFYLTIHLFYRVPESHGAHTALFHKAMSKSASNSETFDSPADGFDSLVNPGSVPISRPVAQITLAFFNGLPSFRVCTHLFGTPTPPTSRSLPSLALNYPHGFPRAFPVRLIEEEPLHHVIQISLFTV